MGGFTQNFPKIFYRNFFIHTLFKGLSPYIGEKRGKEGRGDTPTGREGGV
jgi:hypothetical protein